MNYCPSVVIDYFTYTPFHLLQWTQLIFSFASVIVVIYTIVAYLRKSWFEGVFKETVYALYFLILWHAVFTIILQLIQIIVRMAAKSPCDMQIDRRICILRLIITFPFPSFVWIHATITVQRIVTSFTGNRTLHTVIARAMLVVTVAYCIGYVFVGYKSYQLEGQTPYCSGFVADSQHILVIGTFIMMFMDLLNVGASFLLIRYNRKKIRQLSAAPLAVKFRYRQTLHSIQQMLPVAFFHLFCFTFQYIGFDIGTSLPLPEVQLITVVGFLYSMPYYCFICPSILLWLMIRDDRNKKNKYANISKTTSEEMAESYFNAFQSQWGSIRQVEKKKSRRYLPNENRISSA